MTTGSSESLLDRIERLVWSPPNDAHVAWQVQGIRLVRTALVLGRDLAFGQLTLRAMSLVYTTLLSIVPLLALSFSVLKAFGVYNQIQPLLLNLLEPLGDKGVELAQRMGEFIENMNVGVLGALGLTLLLYTAISLMQKVEESLNFIWHISNPRSLADRASRYLTVLLVGPILVFSAMGLTATVMNADTVRQLLAVGALSDVVQLTGRLLPYLLVIAAFTFVYLFIPNARVRFLPALVGGAIGGALWQTAGWLFANFVATSSQYAAIYSSFAILVLFMIWLYASWLTLLFGASVAFYVQQPEYLYLEAGEPRLSNRVRERLALSAMNLTATRFLAGQKGPSLLEFSHLLGVPSHSLNVVLAALESRSLLVQSADDEPLFLPARDPALISVAQMLDAVNSAGEARFFAPQTLPADPTVDRLLDKVQAVIESSVGGISLRDLALELPQEDGQEPMKADGLEAPPL